MMGEVSRLGFNELMGRWAHDTRATPISRTIVLSAPAGSDRDAVHEGVRAFCSQWLDHRWDYGFARHDDTPNPHAHLVVRALGRDGDMFHPSPTDLWSWREGFAQALQRQGLDVEATPRRARGVTLKGESSKARYLREDYENGRRGEPRFMRMAKAEASRLIEGEGAALKPWEEALLNRRREVRSAYLRVAEELGRSASPDDHQLASAIRTYLQDMPAPHTKRFLMALQEEARQLRKSIERGRDDRDAPDVRRRERDR